MLPPGLSADPAPSSDRSALTRVHPAARTVVRLLVGACSCDLVRPRLEDSVEDEREHRRRYHRGRLARTEIIRELERHRRGPDPRLGPGRGWSFALAEFVAEHARNAGPTLYFLDFLPHDSPRRGERVEPVRRTVAEVRSTPSWLIENQPILVE
jgi:hypothetical protein